MNTFTTPERVLTELDHVRLRSLARSLPADAVPRRAITALLDEADLTPSREVPPDVVTMYSQVQVRYVGTGAVRQLVVCYPEDADAPAGFVSVLSPAGSALLGLRPGDVARWRTPDGAETGAELLAVAFQPEASGDYEL